LELVQRLDLPLRRRRKKSLRILHLCHLISPLRPAGFSAGLVAKIYPPLRCPVSRGCKVAVRGAQRQPRSHPNGMTYILAKTRLALLDHSKASDFDNLLPMADSEDSKWLRNVSEQGYRPCSRHNLFEAATERIAKQSSGNSCLNTLLLANGQCGTVIGQRFRQTWCVSSHRCIFE